MSGGPSTQRCVSRRSVRPPLEHRPGETIFEHVFNCRSDVEFCGAKTRKSLTPKHRDYRDYLVGMTDSWGSLGFKSLDIAETNSVLLLIFERPAS